MNDTISCLLNRRSVRAYRPEQIKPEELEEILQAGLYAPSAMNRQSAVMLVIQDRETISMLSRLNAEVMGRDTDPFYGAPTVIVVLADKNAPNHVQDASLVMGNLMNAAFSLGVDSCWINRAHEVFEMPEARALLREKGISDDYVGVGNCILGYRSGELPPAPSRREGRIIKL